MLITFRMDLLLDLIVDMFKWAVKNCYASTIYLFVWVTGGFSSPNSNQADIISVIHTYVGI
jgi:hypothetical protein